MRRAALKAVISDIVKMQVSESRYVCCHATRRIAIALPPPPPPPAAAAAVAAL